MNTVGMEAGPAFSAAAVESTSDAYRDNGDINNLKLIVKKMIQKKERDSK